MISEDPVTKDPNLLPGYQTEPLFGTHEPRNEIQYDEATGALDNAEDVEERPVSPTELFFDLFFAALLSKLGHDLADHLSKHPLQVLYYILIFQLIYQNWVQVTSYINRFASETASDKLFVAWNLIGLGGVSLNVFRCMRGETGHDCGALASWLAFGRGGVCIWFVLTMYHTRHNRSKGYEFSRISLVVNLISGLLMAIASIFYTNDGNIAGLVLLTTSAIVDILSIPVLWHFHPRYRQSYVPVNANLAAERFGLIYLVSLGELVLNSVSMDFHSDDKEPRLVRGSAIMLLGVFTGLLFLTAFFTVYDLQADRARKHALEVSMMKAWAILHITSILSLLSSLVAAVFARLSNHKFDATDRLVLWLTLSIKIILFSGSNRLYLRHVRVAYGWIADLIAIICLAGIGLGVSPTTLDNEVVVGILIGIWGVLMFVRGVLLPVQLTDQGEEEIRHSTRRESLLRRLPKIRRPYDRRRNEDPENARILSASSYSSPERQ